MKKCDPNMLMAILAMVLICMVMTKREKYCTSCGHR